MFPPGYQDRFSALQCVVRYWNEFYYKQEKFNLAEIHFRKALSINPSSSVLYCHVGV
ncbi:anaphase-promoting complex subunit cdc27, partial [Desmophyllum pertusum]